jgi:hypothetical protein
MMSSMMIDWFSPAQCVGYVAFVLGVGCFLQSDDRRFKLFMAGECLAYIVHFALLDNPTAVASTSVSLLRSLLALRTRSLWVVALVIALNVGLGLAFVRQPGDGRPRAASSRGGGGLWGGCLACGCRWPHPAWGRWRYSCCRASRCGW